MRHRLSLCAVGDFVRHPPPPEALFAQPPAAQRALDDGMHLQPAGVVAARPVRFAGKHGREVDEHGDRRIDAAEGLRHGLAVMADRLELTH